MLTAEQVNIPPPLIRASTFLAATSLSLSESTYFMDDSEVSITISKKLVNLFDTDQDFNKTKAFLKIRGKKDASNCLYNVKF